MWLFNFARKIKLQTRNPKHEIRDKVSIVNDKNVLCFLNFELSDLFLISDFGIRI